MRGTLEFPSANPRNALLYDEGGLHIGSELYVMLKELIVRNLAIIDASTLSFSKGLNVLSGETGAGKSIIVNAINLIQGRRTSADIIRSDAREATVEALFDVSENEAILNKMDSLGLKRDESLVVKRVVSHSDKNKVFLNGGLATLGMLASIGEDLITVSGQHENLVLLNAERHVDILDDFGHLLAMREHVEILFNRLRKLSGELAGLTLSAEKRAERAALLDFQFSEIEHANLRAGEDEDLRTEKNILMNAERLLACADDGYNTLYGGKGSVIENLKTVKKNIKEVSQIDCELGPLCDGMASAIIELEDIALSLRDYTRRIEFDPATLEEIAVRLTEINKLKKKYGATIDEILQHKEKMGRELKDISRSGDTLARLREEIRTVERETLDLATQLSEKRTAAAERLKISVEKELRSMGMERTKFEAVVTNRGLDGKINSGNNVDLGDQRITDKGIDRVEFLLSPNPGEAPKALAKIASGGELSRIILALKSILAQRGGVETLIFDEVDAGIGGRMADVVGHKLRSTSEFHQVICITHLAQIARFAETHYNISKTLKDGRTFASAKRLDGEERVDEIARMLAGAEITDTLKDHAREMVEKAAAYTDESRYLTAKSADNP